MDTLNKAIADIKNKNIIQNSEKILLSFSGGADSVFLFLILNQIVSKKNLQIIYFDHQLRNTADDYNFIYEFEKKFKVKIHTQKLEVKKLSVKEKISIQVAGRKLRQTALIKFAQTYNINKICTAHNFDDMCETFIHRLIRGVKTKLNPMSIENNMQNFKSFIKPILNISKLEIINYLNTKKIKYFEDPSNSTTKYTRNFIRHNILPNFEKLNPNYRNNFKNLFTYFSDLEEYLDSQINPYLGYIKKELNTIHFPLDIYNKINPFLQKKLIYKLTKITFGESYPIEEKHINLIWENCKNPTKKFVLDLPEKGKFYLLYNKLWMMKNYQNEISFKYKIDNNIPPSLKIKEINKTIYFEKMNFDNQIDFAKNSCYLDYEKLIKSLPLTIRSRKEKDKFKPIGSKIHKLLKKYLINQKIPIFWRNTLPLLSTNNSLICIIGFQVSDDYKIDEHTNQIIKISIS